jgi:hypothetical protein
LSSKKSGFSQFIDGNGEHQKTTTASALRVAAFVIICVTGYSVLMQF